MQSETLPDTSVDIPDIVRRELVILRREKELIKAKLLLERMNVATIITVSDALNRNRVRSEPVNYYRSKMILRIQEIGEFLAEFNVEADVVET